MLFQSNIKKVYWGEVVLLVVTIVNVLPFKILKWHSPHELFYGKTVDYIMIHTFGYLCYYTDTQPSKGKFNHRAKVAVFIGFSKGQKGYKFLDLQTKSFLVFRDVVFHDKIFPLCNAVEPT